MNYDRKRVKAAARRHVKRHYVLLIVLCAVSIFLGTEFTGVVSNAQTWYDLLTGQETQLDMEGVRGQRSGNRQVIDDLIEGNLEAGREEAAARLQEMQSAQTDSMLGRSRGVFAALANNLSSGQLYATLGTALNAVIRSQKATGVIMILLSVALQAVVWIFLRNMYRAVMRRTFMETRVYEAYTLNHLLHFRLVKRWNRAALTLLMQSVYQTLWDLTIVGGFIKHYSYYMVPWIVAENPDIRPREAIMLSRRMMNGHKWECFLLEFSFIGWRLLGFVTFGAVNVLWTVPYRVAAGAEYYAALREAARHDGLEGAAQLNDDCLFAAADKSALRQRYGEILRLEGVLDEDIVELTPVRRFFAVNFGIWLGSLDEKKVYSRQAGLRQQTRVGRLELEGKAYPQRMNPLWTREGAALTGKVNYLAPCTVWSLIVAFLAFCIFGWVWEVSVTLASIGKFVNRGALHGPWLPIYGTGVIMISVLLYRFRRKPALEAVLVMLLCGLVEYWISYFMERSYGMRWWDYTGYFLNLNGRICGEGLAVFAVGGMAAVYFLVPLIDEAVTKVKPRILVPVCIVLMVVYMADWTYSQFVPNVGTGITDIGEETESLPTE